MIKKRVESLLNLSGVCKLMVFDLAGFEGVYDYIAILKEYGFKIVQYTNVESFRLEYEENHKNTTERIATIIKNNIYVPYDIQQKFRKVSLSLEAVFPKLHTDTLMKYRCDMDLISFAYDNCYADAKTPQDTDDFIRKVAFSEHIINCYCTSKIELLRHLCEIAGRYTDWITIARLKTVVHYYATLTNLEMDFTFADEAFARFIERGYETLSTEIGTNAPTIVTKALRFISGKGNRKIALIVMDGMSLFDFEAISRHFTGIEYEFNCTFVIIPTTTPLSRQSLLSAKFPRELEKPFSLANEEKEFVAEASGIGYNNNQIQFLRRYEPVVSQFAKFITVVINEVDDIVHGQRQGRIGMYNDMHTLGKSGKLQKLIKELAKSGFDVYITSDHGNTPCVGVGGFRSGVEMQSKSMRMAVLKDFAEKHKLLDKYTTEYSGHYLDKSFKYLVCLPGVSFDNKGESVMTHGGMTLDEVIVPFVKIKGVV